MAVIEGAGHLSFSDPTDPTTARGFLEADPGPESGAHRQLIGDLVVGFLDRPLALRGEQRPLIEVGADAMLAEFRVR